MVKLYDKHAEIVFKKAGILDNKYASLKKK